MTEGRPGTMMPQFTKTFTPEEIGQVSGYVVSLQSPNGPAPGGLRGDPMAGESVFFMPGMAHSCSVCHSMKGRGGRVGPDLASKVAGRSAREIFQKIIVVPHRASDPAYVTMKLTTKVGLVLTGIKAGETADVIRFYDTSSLPPLLRTIAKSDIVESAKYNSSVMPNDYAARLTLQQLLNVVAFLKSSDGGSQMPVTLNDVIN